MFDLDQAIRDWKKALAGPGALSEGKIAELEKEKKRWNRVHGVLALLWKPGSTAD